MASHNPDQPNILFVLTDDQGAWAMGCAGNDEIRTPNLDRLAATGVRCENFFCASPNRRASPRCVAGWLRGLHSTSILRWMGQKNRSVARGRPISPGWRATDDWWYIDASGNRRADYIPQRQACYYTGKE